jgi:hypothetical protein
LPKSPDSGCTTNGDKKSFVLEIFREQKKKKVKWLLVGGGRIIFLEAHYAIHFTF